MAESAVDRTINKTKEFFSASSSAGARIGTGQATSGDFKTLVIFVVVAGVSLGIIRKVVTRNV